MSPGTDAGPLRDRLLERFRQPFDSPMSDAEFNQLALASFQHQFARNPPFAAWCRARGAVPGRIDHWSAVPAVPTGAFKHVELVAGDAATAQATFRTSGTTRGADRRGTHHVLDLALYHGSLLPTFAAFLLPDGARPTMVSLLPPAAQLPDSSLAHMVDRVVRTFGDEHSGWFASARDGLDIAALHAALEHAVRAGRAVCLLGTSLSFVHWLDALRDDGRDWHLPPGSRLMDTGGYKGLDRSVPAERLVEDYHSRLGLDPAYCINEYGMTELCSQYYDTALRDVRFGAPAEHRRKAGPPWLRTRAVDAETLQPVPAGTPGLLQHFDLANLGSVLAVQTEDIGTVDDDGVRLLGRVTDAQPRGCSIAMDELLQAARAVQP